jgi:predicted O-methyltransferase YrrM
MTRRVSRVVVGLLLLVAVAAPAAAQTREQQQILDAIRRMDRDLLSVSEQDGRFLRVMVVNTGAKRAIEIGGAYGYSAIWIGLGLQQTGGHLTTFEADAARAKIAADNIRRAGLSDVVTVVPGDAFQQIPKTEAGVDFVFLDAWKRDYQRFLDLMLPRMRPRAVFLAHNVVNKRAEMGGFLDAIEHNPDLVTAIVSPGTEGMSVSVKIR